MNFYDRSSFSMTGSLGRMSRQTSFKTWWTFRIFFIFSARGSGKGSSRRQDGAGGGYLLKIPGGGVSRTGGGEGLGGCLRGFGGGGGG